MYGSNNMKKSVVFNNQFTPKLGGQFELESGGQFAPELVVNLHWKVVVNLTGFSSIGLVLLAISGTVMAAPIVLPATVVAVAGYMAVAGGVISAVSQMTVAEENLNKSRDGD